MRTRRAWIFFTLFVAPLTGCSSTWTHPEYGTTNFQADKYECQRYATQYAHDFGASGNFLIIASQMKDCLKAKGYVEVDDFDDAPPAKAIPVSK